MSNINFGREKESINWWYWKNIIKIDTFKVKASQLNHSTNEYEKKSLSKRWVEILGKKIQRDLYSAFLIKNVKENLEEVNIEKAQKEFKNFVKLHKEEEVLWKN